MAQVTVGKWDDDLVVRLPGDVLRCVELRDGERVDVSTADGAIVIRRIEPEVTLDGLFDGKTDDEWRAIYAADRYDWGPDVGREIVPE